MALFRALTAEEEAATAIVHALKRHKYQGADRINPYRHDQKAAFPAIVMTVVRAFDHLHTQGHDPAIEIPMEETQGGVRLRLTFPFPNGQLKWVYPNPPLNFTRSVNGILDDLAEEMAGFLRDRGSHEGGLRRYLNEQANLRNRILYASPDGVPEIEGSVSKDILRKRQAVFMVLTVFLMIDPHPRQQLFVQQCLDAFLPTVTTKRRPTPRVSKSKPTC
jgi:hypothetical protein